MERPSDEVTAEVLKIVYQEPDWQMEHEGDHFHCSDHNGQYVKTIPDPREDTDDALRLLGYARASFRNQYAWNFTEHGWFVATMNVVPMWSQEVPIAGPAMRYATITLAARVLGVE